jgi:hypothetical protein
MMRPVGRFDGFTMSATATDPNSISQLSLLRAGSLTLDTQAGEFASISLLSSVLLSIAAWNGFPLIFYDTGAYILEGLGHIYVVERSPAYSLFLLFAGARMSLWFIAAVQAVATSFVMTELARAEVPALTVSAIISIGAGLTALTGVAWYVGEIEPDCFAAIVVVATYLLAFRSKELGLARAAATLCIVALAAAVHTSHLGLMAGLVVAVAIARAACELFPGVGLACPRLAFPITGVGLAVLIALSSSYYLTGEYFISRAGPGFVFARLLQDGIVKKLLDDTCPTAGYKLCAYKDELPTRADAWLWGGKSPFNKLDRFHGMNPELMEIIEDAFARYPSLNAQAALHDTEIQFFAFRTGDQIEPQEWLLRRDFGQFIPTQVGDYLAARQQRGLLRFGFLNRIHVPVGALSLLGILLIFGHYALRKDWTRSTLAAFILLSLAGNAFICGVLSNPHDRYQSRLMWVPTFVIAILLYGRDSFVLRMPVESGT